MILLVNYIHDVLCWLQFVSIFCFSFWFLSSSLFSVKYGDYICMIFLGFVHAFLNTLLGVWSDTYMYIFVHINILFCQLYVTISCDIFMSQLESNYCCSTMNFNYSFMFAHNDVCFKLQPDCRAYIDGHVFLKCLSNLFIFSFQI